MKPACFTEKREKMFTTLNDCWNGVPTFIHNKNYSFWIIFSSPPSQKSCHKRSILVFFKRAFLSWVSTVWPTTARRWDSCIQWLLRPLWPQAIAEPLIFPQQFKKKYFPDRVTKKYSTGYFTAVKRTSYLACIRKSWINACREWTVMAEKLSMSSWDSWLFGVLMCPWDHKTKGPCTRVDCLYAFPALLIFISSSTSP